MQASCERVNDGVGVGCIIGYRLRASTVTALYNKALRLSRATRNERDSGQMINLMAVDATRMQVGEPVLKSQK
jgi:hypothetical protein